MANIKFEKLEINSISYSSGVFSGTNTPSNWKHKSKSTEGFGTISGDKNFVKRNITILNEKKES